MPSHCIATLESEALPRYLTEKSLWYLNIKLSASGIICYLRHHVDILLICKSQRHHFVISVTEVPPYFKTEVNN